MCIDSGETRPHTTKERQQQRYPPRAESMLRLVWQLFMGTRHHAQVSVRQDSTKNVLD